MEEVDMDGSESDQELTGNETDESEWASKVHEHWLIDWCLTSSEQFFSYIQDENIKKFKRHGTRNKERWWVHFWGRDG
jgi:hypothetical protein